MSVENVEKMIEEMDSLLTDPKIPVSGYAVSIVKNGKIAFERQCGFRRIDEDTNTVYPMEVGTRYRIASISKVFTALGIMQMYDQGKLDLDEDASKYLGFSLRNPYYPDAVITPRMMLSHISSIRDGSAYALPSKTHIREAFLEGGSFYCGGEHFAAPDGEHDMRPGGYYFYCNLNFGLLGTMIERLSGERFDDYMVKHVLAPLGTKASYNLGDFDAEEIKNVSEIFKRFGDGIWDVSKPWCAQMDVYKGIVQPKNIVSINNPDLGTANYDEDVSDYEIGTNGTIFSPQGGLRISAHELALLAQMFLNKGVSVTGERIISEKAVEQMKTPVWWYQPEKKNKDMDDSFYSCGAGLNIISSRLGGDRAVEDRDDLTLYGHTGSAYGLLSACYFDPERNCAFAFAFNGTGADTELNRGTYSRRTVWLERMMTAIYKYYLV